MYKLAIEDRVDVPVKFTLKSKGIARLFQFTLDCTRLTQDEIATSMEENEHKVKTFMKPLIGGWSNQRLVLLESNEPADFCPEALDVMLNTAGVAMAIYNAYAKECGAKEKN